MQCFVWRQVSPWLIMSVFVLRRLLWKLASLLKNTCRTYATFLIRREATVLKAHDIELALWYRMGKSQYVFIEELAARAAKHLRTK
jgi:hypothetical protein